MLVLDARARDVDARAPRLRGPSCRAISRREEPRRARGGSPRVLLGPPRDAGRPAENAIGGFRVPERHSQRGWASVLERQRPGSVSPRARWGRRESPRFEPEGHDFVHPERDAPAVHHPGGAPREHRFAASQLHHRFKVVDASVAHRRVRGRRRGVLASVGEHRSSLRFDYLVRDVRGDVPDRGDHPCRGSRAAAVRGVLDVRVLLLRHRRLRRHHLAEQNL